MNLKPLMKCIVACAAAWLLFGCTSSRSSATATTIPVTHTPIQAASPSPIDTSSSTSTAVPIAPPSLGKATSTETTPARAPQPSLTYTALPSQTRTQAPSSTPKLPVSPPPTYNPTTMVGYQCLEKRNALPKEAGIVGTLVLEKDFGSYFLLDLAANKQTSLSSDSQELFSLTISPNHEHILYASCIDTTCKATITSPSAPPITIPDEPFWRSLVWLDNERLAILHDSEPYNSTIVLNPFTGEKKTVNLLMPNPYYFNTLDNTRILLNRLDPTLTRVVYFNTEGVGKIILWDNVSRKELASLPFIVPDDPSAPPPDIDYLDGWSPDGSQFVTTSPITFTDKSESAAAIEELFSISLDGQVMQLTHLGAYYKYVHISKYRWSPDGHFIAFWMQTADNPDQTPNIVIQRFAILDMKNQKVVDYCLPFGSSEYSTVISPPLWAPNSQQIIIQTHFGDDIWPVSLLDLANNYFVPISTDLSPVGWLVSP